LVLALASCSGVSVVDWEEELPPEAEPLVPPELDDDPLPADDPPDDALPLSALDVPLWLLVPEALPLAGLEALPPDPAPEVDCPELELQAAVIIARIAMAEITPVRLDRNRMWAS
jgi:hypothetical protein